MLLARGGIHTHVRATRACLHTGLLVAERVRLAVILFCLGTSLGFLDSIAYTSTLTYIAMHIYPSCCPVSLDRVLVILQVN